MSQQYATAKKEGERALVLQSTLADTESQLANSKSQIQAVTQQYKQAEESWNSDALRIRQEHTYMMKKYKESMEKQQAMEAEIQQKQQDWDKRFKLEHEQWQSQCMQSKHALQEYKEQTEAEKKRWEEEKKSFQAQLVMAAQRSLEEKKTTDARFDKINEQINEVHRQRQDMERKYQQEKFDRECESSQRQFEIKTKTQQVIDLQTKVQTCTVQLEKSQTLEGKLKQDLEDLRLSKTSVDIELNLIKQQSERNRREDSERITSLQKEVNAMAHKARMQMLAFDTTGPSSDLDFFRDTKPSATKGSMFGLPLGFTLASAS